VFSHGTSIGETGSFVNAQADAVFQIGHRRAKKKNDQHADHTQYETNSVEQMSTGHA
jgi:hypothetical protein